MGYANIIAVLSGGLDDRETLVAAARLAKDAKGLVRVLVSLPVEAASVWADTFGGTYFAPQVVEAVAEANAEIRHRSDALARDVAGEIGLEYGRGSTGGRIEFANQRETAWLALIREAPLADLIVMGESVVQVDGFWSGIAAEALMFARAPVLIVRSGAPLTGEIAAIAWDGSLAAGRAVRAAMPLLKAAASVIILQDPSGLSAAERDAGAPEALKAELLRRGVTAVTIAEVEGGREGPRLIKAAKSANAGLIISGAYGHSRLGEAIFGGATRAFVQAQTDAHHFLAH